MINDFHRLLRRQIKAHFGGLEQVPPSLMEFFKNVNSSYKDFDKDLEHVEHILKVSSQELFKANKELNLLNEQNEKIIQEKAQHLQKITYSLQSAEKIASLGNFSLTLKDRKVETSRQLEEMFQLKNSEINNELSRFISVFTDGERILNAIEKCIEKRQKFQLEDVKLKNDDRYFVMEGDLFAADDTSSEALFVGVFRDVTGSKLREAERDEILEALEHYKNAIDYTGIVSITDEKGIITYVNKKFCEVSQYTASELIGAKHNIVNSGLHDRDFFLGMWKTISSGKTWKGIVRNKKKDGTFYWVDSTIVPFFKNGRINQYISIRFDITEKILFQEKIEEQRSFYDTILNNIPVDIAVFDPDHRYLFINPFAVNNTEVREFLIGKTDFDYCEHYGKEIKIAEKRRELFNRAKNASDIIEFIDHSFKKDGSEVFMLRRFFPIINKNSELLYVLGFGIDITEKMQQSIKLAESLEEKEALLGEVHHRVKNNLALVMGLVEMQGARTDNDYIRSQLSEIQHRISAMALIHEKLYKSANFSRIDMKDYLQDFVKFLCGFFGKGKKINLHFDLDSIHATTKRAIPVALIVNELVTNSFKYAFNNKSTGDVFISFKQSDEGQELTIRDNGPGVPEGMDLTKVNSLGFKLLNIFTKQLKGKFELENNPGLCVKIKFANEQEGTNS